MRRGIIGLKEGARQEGREGASNGREGMKNLSSSVWWSEEEKVLQMLELTISYESVMEQARQVKQAKYQDLIDEVRRAGYRA